ncbi:MAG TPA: Mut7-C RNAse domain-containing protein [Deltaproteobacteria bacterium]|nr:Mut7-C RNAse domain-containing protein [Deltaproteobacteria bacterium]
MPSGPNPPSFACDRNLGRLAKWLRLMGFDTLYLRDDDPHRLLGAALSGRIVLTRRRALRGRPGVVVVERDRALDQVREVVSSLGLEGPLDAFSRCSLCNEPLVEETPEGVSGLVPDHVLATRDRFARCPSCGRVYWKGTHLDRARGTMEAVFRDREP